MRSGGLDRASGSSGRGNSPPRRSACATGWLPRTRATPFRGPSPPDRAQPASLAPRQIIDDSRDHQVEMRAAGVLEECNFVVALATGVASRAEVEEVGLDVIRRHCPGGNRPG